MKLYTRVCGQFRGPRDNVITCADRLRILAESLTEAMNHAERVRCRECGGRFYWWIEVSE